MLRTTIQTRDEITGEELPVPADLRTRVERAAELLQADLAKLATKFDIEAQWLFERRSNELAAVLRLSSTAAVVSSEPTPAQLTSDDAVRRWLWTPTGAFVNILSERGNREIADAFRGIYATLEECRNEDAGEVAHPADRGTLQTNT